MANHQSPLGVSCLLGEQKIGQSTRLRGSSRAQEHYKPEEGGKYDKSNTNKYQQTKKQWRVPRGTHNGPLVPRTIQAGDSGIFATCNKGREKKCVGELRDLFAEYAELLYGDENAAGAKDGEGDGEGEGGVEDIEKDIKAEIEGIQKPAKAAWFVPVKLEVQCGELLFSFARVGAFCLSWGFSFSLGEEDLAKMEKMGRRS